MESSVTTVVNRGGRARGHSPWYTAERLRRAWPWLAGLYFVLRASALFLPESPGPTKTPQSPTAMAKPRRRSRRGQHCHTPFVGWAIWNRWTITRAPTQRWTSCSRRAGRAVQAGIAAAHAELAKLTAEAAETMATRGWGWGFRSMQARVAFELGLTPYEARQLITIADRLGELPQLAEAHASGRAGIGVTAAIAEVATANTEHTLVELTRHASGAQMQRICATYRSQPAKKPRPRFVSLTGNDTGWDLRGRLDATEGEAVRKGLEALRAGLVKDCGPEVTNADALVAAITGSRGHTSGADRYLALINVDLERYRNGEPGAGNVPDGPTLTNDELAQILEDCSRVVQVNHHGRPAWISDQARTPPPWMRRILRARQPSCRILGSRPRATSSSTTSCPTPNSAPQTSTPTCACAGSTIANSTGPAPASRTPPMAWCCASPTAEPSRIVPHPPHGRNPHHRPKTPAHPIPPRPSTTTRSTSSSPPSTASTHPPRCPTSPTMPTRPNRRLIARRAREPNNPGLSADAPAWASTPRTFPVPRH